MSNSKQKWARIKYENSKAFALFCIYRDFGPTRTLERVHQKYIENSSETISLRQIASYSSKNNWVERSEAYDDYLEEKTRLSNEEEIEKMNKRHAEDAKTIQDKALDDLSNVDYSTEYQASPEGRRMAAARTWKIGVDAERLARGVATEKVEQSGTIKQRHSGEIETDPIDEFNRIMDNALENVDDSVQDK